MDQGALELGRASCRDAARDRLAFGPHYRATASRTLLRHLELLEFSLHLLASIGEHLHYFWNDLAALFDKHPVADLQIESSNLVLIMKRGPRHGRAGKQHRLEIGHWSE